MLLLYYDVVSVDWQEIIRFEKTKRRTRTLEMFNARFTFKYFLKFGINWFFLILISISRKIRFYKTRALTTIGLLVSLSVFRFERSLQVQREVPREERDLEKRSTKRVTPKSFYIYYSTIYNNISSIISYGKRVKQAKTFCQIKAQHRTSSTIMLLESVHGKKLFFN